tara:strand:+ start:772 stop:1242 length:471 start_codon:yes stop_codon:yes gene_type:complete
MDIKIKTYASALFENELFLCEVSIESLIINYEEYINSLPKKSEESIITADEVHNGLVLLQSTCIMQTRDRFVGSPNIKTLKNSMNVMINIDLPYSGKAVLMCALYTNQKYQNSDMGAFGAFLQAEGRNPDVLNFDESRSEYHEPDIQINEKSIEEV